MHRITFLLLIACGGGTTPECAGDGECPLGERCVDGTCVAFDAGRDFDAGKPDGGSDAGVLPDGGRDAGTPDAGPDAGCDDPPPAERTAPISCATCRPDTPEPGEPTGGCMTHAECTEGENGRCVRAMVGAFCDYDECFSDNDCADNEVCSCDGSYYGGNACVPSNCRTSADCAGTRCTPTYGCLAGGPPEGWYCRTASDECVEDADCDEAGMAGGRCAFDPTRMLWACEYGICVF